MPCGLVGVAVGVQAGYHRQRAGLVRQMLDDLRHEFAKDEGDDQGAQHLQTLRPGGGPQDGAREHERHYEQRNRPERRVHHGEERGEGLGGVVEPQNKGGLRRGCPGRTSSRAVTAMIAIDRLPSTTAMTGREGFSSSGNRSGLGLPGLPPSTATFPEPTR